MQSPGCRPLSWDAEFLMLKRVGNRHPGPAGWLVSPGWVLTVAWPGAVESWDGVIGKDMKYIKNMFVQLVCIKENGNRKQ